MSVSPKAPAVLIDQWFVRGKEAIEERSGAITNPFMNLAAIEDHQVVGNTGAQVGSVNEVFRASIRRGSRGG